MTPPTPTLLGFTGVVQQLQLLKAARQGFQGHQRSTMGPLRDHFATPLLHDQSPTYHGVAFASSCKRQRQRRFVEQSATRNHEGFASSRMNNYYQNHRVGCQSGGIRRSFHEWLDSKNKPPTCTKATSTCHKK